MYEKELFIGRKLVGVRSRHPLYEKVRGVIVNETMKTVIVNMDGREILLPKAGNSFGMDFDGKTIWIEGRRILYRPEDRIKKVK